VSTIRIADYQENNIEKIIIKVCCNCCCSVQRGWSSWSQAASREWWNSCCSYELTRSSSPSLASIISCNCNAVAAVRVIGLYGKLLCVRERYVVW